MATQKILFKRGFKADLIAKLKGENKPAEGEPIYELPEDGSAAAPKIKIGDGVHDYEALAYLGEGGTSSQVYFGSHYEFPAVGKVGVLYVATDENNSYIWKTNKYVILSVEQQEIDGGDAYSF